MGKLIVESRIGVLNAKAQQLGDQLKGVFIDIHNPEMVSAAEDSMDAKLRRAIFERWGAEKVPVHTVWPAV